MAYTINLTDGAIFATVADGTINNAAGFSPSAPLTLVGKNYAGYGEFLNENFIHLLENGANSVAPGAPLAGQLWWDKSTNTMKVYTGVTFKTISGATSSATAPTNNVVGDLWWDSVNQQLKVWNGSAFVLIGPAFTPGTGQTGAIVGTITDSSLVDHVVIQLFVQNVLVGIVSKDPLFTPQTSISGFATIRPGIQLSTAAGIGALFQGTATDSQTLDGLDSIQFLRSDINDTTSGTLGVLNDTGFRFGVDQDGSLSVVTANSEVIIRNQTNDANLSVRVNDGGSDTVVMFVNGSTSAVTFPTTVSVTGNVSAGNVSAGNISGNLSVTNLTGTLLPSQGGTGITAVGTSGNVLTSNGTAWISAAAAAGNVTGPASSTTNFVALFDGTNGRLLKNSSAQDGFIHGVRVGRGANASTVSNMVVGNNALGVVTTGTDNTALGFNALAALTTGSDNIAIGRDSLLQITGASFNTIVGGAAGSGITSGTNNTHFGWASGPLLGPCTGGQNTSIGRGSMTDIISGNLNSAIGELSGSFITTGNNNTCLGARAGRNTSPFQITTQSNRVVIGDNDVTDIYGAVVLTVTSDARDKTDVQAITQGLDLITRLNPVTFRWDRRSSYFQFDGDGNITARPVPNGEHKKPRLFSGFLAQDIQVATQEVGYPADVIVDAEDPDNLKLKETALIPVLVKAVQELKAELDAVKAELAALKS